MSMLTALVGSEGAERVLLFITAREQGYASEIAETFKMDVSTIQNQLARMEREGLLINNKVGRTRVYSFNPRYAFLKETKALTQRALDMAPQRLADTLKLNRRRPRRAGKPL